MDTKICKTCNKAKAVTEFYKRFGSPDGLQYICKTCLLETNSKKRKGVKSNVHEQAFIATLAANGIPAMQSVAISKVSYTDVIAWGCVRVEVKYPVKQGNQYIYKFTKRQTEKQLACDLIVLVYPTDTGEQYHVFSPLHAVFFHKNQTRKQNLAYTPNAVHKNANGATLTDDIMRTHQDNWYLIETMRLDKSRVLKHQSQIPAAHTATEGKAA